MNSRLVELKLYQASAPNELLVQMPPSGHIYPPGYAWIFVLVNGIPSEGLRMMVGSGKM